MSNGSPVSALKPNALRSLSNRPKTVIGVVHAPALPGAPGYDGTPMEEVYAAALADAIRYARGGVDALIVENHGDIPFSKPEDLGPETAASLAVMVDRVRRAVDLPVGVNVLANGAIHALAVAKAAGAPFVRVNQWANAYVANEGILEGPAAAATRYRAWLHGRGINVFADVHAKHGAHAIVADRTIPELTRDAEFFDADAVIAGVGGQGPFVHGSRPCARRGRTTLTDRYSSAFPNEIGRSSAPRSQSSTIQAWSGSSTGGVARSSPTSSPARKFRK